MVKFCICDGQEYDVGTFENETSERNSGNRQNNWEFPYKFQDVAIGMFNNTRVYLNIEQAKLLCNKHLVDVNTDLLNQIAKLTKTNKKLYKEKQRLRRRLQELKR